MIYYRAKEKRGNHIFAKLVCSTWTNKFVVSARVHKLYFGDGIIIGYLIGYYRIIMVVIL